MADIEKVYDDLIIINLYFSANISRVALKPENSLIAP